MSRYQIATKCERGHLTARERQIVSHALAQGWTLAESRLLRVELEPLDGATLGNSGRYEVKTTKAESDDWGRMRQRTTRATVSIKRMTIEANQPSNPNPKSAPNT